MKITLSKIKKHDPCPDGWEKILAAQGPDLDREWELVEAFQSNGLEDVLWALRCLPEHNRLWRKYAVWCVMQVEHLLIDQRSQDALEVAWRHSDGLASDAELAAGIEAAWAAASDAERAARDAAIIVSLDAEIEAALAEGIAVAIDAENDAAESATYAAESARYATWAAAVAAAGSAAGSAARYAELAAARVAASAAAWASAKAAARAAQKERLIQILSAGEWVEETENENNTR